MSEHVSEDLVADSVRLRDRHAAPGDPRVRDRFRFPLDRHPDHAGRSDGGSLEDGYVEPPFLSRDAGAA
ncbi:hypothetical protein ACKI1J_02500 [Streptomyces scabiei]|uniref:hypothetical protein n=1 Tax=Streptomyces scabiei TaxID=1930 RepID=UPI0038F6699D